jgi:hypothetical protein
LWQVPARLPELVAQYNADGDPVRHKSHKEM